MALDGNGLAAGLVVVVGGQEVHTAGIYRLGLWPSGCGAVEETSIRFDSLITVSTRREGPHTQNKMTYRSRGRSTIEIIVAVTFVGFLTGFVVVLCIGNYFRAKRAQERQSQRRLAKENGEYHYMYASPDSPRSEYSAASSAYMDEGPERQHLLSLHQRKHVLQSKNKNSSSTTGGGGLYRTQQLNPQYRASNGGGAPDSDGGEMADLLMIPEEDNAKNGPSSDVMSV